jgi:hypothetical protein
MAPQPCLPATNNFALKKRSSRFARKRWRCRCEPFFLFRLLVDKGRGGLALLRVRRSLLCLLCISQIRKVAGRLLWDHGGRELASPSTRRPFVPTYGPILFFRDHCARSWFGLLHNSLRRRWLVLILGIDQLVLPDLVSLSGALTIVLLTLTLSTMLYQKAFPSASFQPPSPWLPAYSLLFLAVSVVGELFKH